MSVRTSVQSRTNASSHIHHQALANDLRVPLEDKNLLKSRDPAPEGSHTIYLLVGRELVEPLEEELGLYRTLCDSYDQQYIVR